MISFVNLCKNKVVRSGANNFFVKINEEIGLKICSSREYRDKMYKNQKEGFLHGIAPETFGILKKTIFIDYISDGRKKRDYFYGYFTEVIPTILNNAPIANTKKLSSQFIADHYDFLTRVLGETLDCHTGNLGINKNGTIVLIDWDSIDSYEFTYYNHSAREKLSQTTTVVYN